LNRSPGEGGRRHKVLFNSVEFFIFLAVVYGLYRVLPFRGQNYMLLAASYFFYGWWDWRFLFLMTLSTTIDYWVGLTMAGRLGSRERLVSTSFLLLCTIVFLGVDLAALWAWINGASVGTSLIYPQLPIVVVGFVAFVAFAETLEILVSRLPEERRRKTCLVISIAVQLLILGTFKYFNFFADSLASGLNSIGLEVEPVLLDIVLPVGISFYTFQSMSYAIDIYRRELEPTKRYFDFALFVAYFPQLVAGPIERARHLLPEVSKPRSIDFDQSTRGVYLILLGLFKKMAVADGVAPSVD
jgi:alginate O-acetyltransferase complex protein AlgI